MHYIMEMFPFVDRIIYHSARESIVRVRHACDSMTCRRDVITRRYYVIQ